MEITYKSLVFTVEGGKVYLTGFRGKDSSANEQFPFAEVQIGGKLKIGNSSSKMIESSEGDNLSYVSHEQKENLLTIVQRSETVEMRTTFGGVADGDAVGIVTEVKNLSHKQIALEGVSSFVLNGFAVKENTERTFFYKFLQSHHSECQPRRISLAEWGFSSMDCTNQKRLSFANIGSWSSKEELPQGILERDGTFIMFQIESNNHWYYELSTRHEQYYLYLSGGDYLRGNVRPVLECGENFRAPAVAIAFSDSLSGVLGEMTKYRRKIAGQCAVDRELPVIFNEYMHLSWDSPSEDATRKIAPFVAKAGADYYVIDCGWHNEEDGNIIYPFVGQWKESKARFPHGVKKTAEFVHSLGMKMGLWIEPEIIGVKCAEMCDFYDDDCFMRRGGDRIGVMGRYFLDFRNGKVREYLTETIRRMVEEYGAEYIKMDYNEDIGIADGLLEERMAYLDWVDQVRRLFPNVLFETCSSGGMRMDYETLRHFSIVSTSDQTDYIRYPYIAGNILSAVLPEQAAVWSYPVVGEEIGREQVIVNMVNAMLGRIHLASDIRRLSEENFALVREGVSYYKSLIFVKKSALPYFPLGFTKFGEKVVACGLRTKNKIYLAVWNLNHCDEIRIPFGEKIRAVNVGYPKRERTDFSAKDGELVIMPHDGIFARFFEIEVSL